MYWLISQFPELDHLEPKQRARLLARLPRWTYPMIAARAISGAILSYAAVCVLLGIAMPLRLAALVGIPLAAAIAFLLYTNELKLLRADMRKTIWEAFRKERPPFCFKCGYDLRQSSDMLCPECGADWRAVLIEH